MSDLKTKQQLRVRKMWIDALRSGEYKQITGKLKSKEGFCCLGVLTDLYVKEGYGEWTEHLSVISGASHYQMSEFSGMLCSEVQNWVGLRHFGGGMHEIRPDNPSEPNNLYMMNDIDGKSFEEIADVIESEPPGLFTK